VASTPYYDIYVNSVYQLAQTLVIQSSATATAMNNAILENPAYQADDITVNPDDNTTWKYYMNLQGLYHPVDTLMYVTSLDTLQTIAFTVANLQLNTATARAYSFGSDYYNALVSRFPTQENLIQRILNPLVLEKDSTGQFVVPADGSILWYDDTLVESNETNLISKLQEWIYVVMDRWNIPAYTITDDLYAAAQLGILFSLMPKKILNIRKANCRTRFVHSFHVREFLASNGGLDSFVDTLDTAQLLWLYRNLPYLQRNAGKQATFQWLVANIMTAAGLPLAEWNMTENTSQMPGELLPTPQFTRNPLNFGYSVTGNDTITLDDMFNLESGCAIGNPSNLEYDLSGAQVLMENSQINQLKTKVLESSVIDMTDAVPYTLSDCLLNQWMYWAYSGRYRAVVNLTDPQSGAPFSMPVLDAFITYLYAYNMANTVGNDPSGEFTLVYVPTVTAGHVQRIPPPTAAELAGLVDSSLVSASDIANVLSNIPVASIYIATDAFYDACLDIQNGILANVALTAAEEDLNARAQMEIISQRCYCDVVLPLGGQTGSQITYAQWFLQKGYTWPTYTAEEWGDLATQLISEATGIDLLNVRNLADLQASMLSLMAQLSSYSIQFIQSINTSTIKVDQWNAARIGTYNVAESDLIQNGLMASYPIKADALSEEFLQYDMYQDSGAGFETAYLGTSKELMAIPIDVHASLDGNIKLQDRVQMSIINFWTPPDVVKSLPGLALNLVSPDYVPLNLQSLSNGFSSQSLTAYAEMTAQDRQILLQRFLGALSNPISSVLHQTLLDGLKKPAEPMSGWVDPFI
jgi:hypothetical protein